ncbi:MAG: VWA domain-containing protein [Treponema sp.]|nr:VWA domain-containing protein [Treponema sp.]
MWNNTFGKTLILSILVGFLPLAANAEDKRTIPLDLYLIIDSSSTLKNSKNDTVAWISSQVVDRILMTGDKITIWTAGDKAQVIFSDTVSGDAVKKQIKDKLAALNTGGKTADYSGALRDVLSRISQASGDKSRLPYTMLVTGSAEGLEPTLSGGSQGLLRWFRSEQYARWQVLVVAPDIGKRVQQAAAAYMASLR